MVLNDYILQLKEVLCRINPDTAKRIHGGLFFSVGWQVTLPV
jgi:hypothetical protein